jgi:hypothetical protein
MEKTNETENINLDNNMINENEHQEIFIFNENNNSENSLINFDDQLLNYDEQTSLNFPSKNDSVHQEVAQYLIDITNFNK